MKWFSLSLLLLILAFGALNYVIDPYALFGAPRIDGLSQIKPSVASRLRLSKPYQVVRYGPKTLIGGNSRPEMGIDPGHQCWPGDVRPVYNIGLPGIGVYRQARTLQHAMYDSDVVLVLWGLDFADFLSVRSKNVGGPPQWPPEEREYETRLRVHANGDKNRDYSVNYLKTFLQTLVSLDSTSDSLATVFQQGATYSSNRLENGFNPANDYIPIIRTEGQRVLFQQKNQEIEARFSQNGLTVSSGDGETSPEFRSLEHFLKTVDPEKRKVYLFINPYHVDYLKAIYRNGLWEQFEQWKVQLVEIANRYRVPLWDFSIITPYNSEPSPTVESGNNILKWFWEPAHYKREVGDMMLATMLSNWCASAPAVPVGIKLDRSKIEQLLNNERKKLAKFQEK